MKHAFAFRDFDRARILTRPFFKSFGFTPEKRDTEIMEELNAAAGDTIDTLEEKLRRIKATHDRLEKYRHLIEKHSQRCDRYNKRKAAALSVTLSELKRYAPTLEYFTAGLDCVELADKLAKLYYELEKQIQERYRKEFTTRLKQARLKAGLKQKELGDLVQVSPQGFSLYERGERDIPIHTVIRLAKVLNISGDEILGLK